MKVANLLKSAFVIIALLGFTPSASAQLEKGSWMVGGYGSLGISGSSVTATLAPSVGYFFRPKTVVGAGLANSFIRYKSNTEVLTGYGLSINPFLRHYFLKPENKFNVFGEVGFNVLSSWQSHIPNYINSSLDLGVGVSYFITPKIALEFTTKYSPNILSLSNNNTFNLRSNLGFQIFF